MSTGQCRQCKSCDCHHYAQLQVSVQSNLRRVIQETGSVADNYSITAISTSPLPSHEFLVPVEQTEEDEADQGDAGEHDHRHVHAPTAGGLALFLGGGELS